MNTPKTYDSPFHATEEPELADALALKTDTMVVIRDSMARNLGITQSRLVDLINGKIGEFTQDELDNILRAIGITK